MPWRELRQDAAAAARSGGRPGGICPPAELTKSIHDAAGLGQGATDKDRMVLMRYWPLAWQVTLKLDEDPVRWIGPLDGDETAGWVILLRDDGELLYGAWHGGWEPYAPKGRYNNPRTLRDIEFRPASDRELALMDLDYTRAYHEYRPHKRYEKWDPAPAVVAPGTGLRRAIEALFQTERVSEPRIYVAPSSARLVSPQRPAGPLLNSAIIVIAVLMGGLWGAAIGLGVGFGLFIVLGLTFDYLLGVDPKVGGPIAGVIMTLCIIVGAGIGVGAGMGAWGRSKKPSD